MKPNALLLILLGVGWAGPAAAQKYRTAAGLRLGSPYGLTVQQAVAPRLTLEGIAGLASREVSGTVLAEYHFGILGRSLNYYLGAGGHVGNNKDTSRFGGFDGVVGIEYKIAFLPLVLSYDFKPSVEINSNDWARFPTAFSVRYVFIRQRNKTIGERTRGLFDKIRGR
ncbi:MAG: hypothetical protein ACRYFR_08735 [Janthinobacterium lividum]